jgi:succinate-semialdehyde dehydrogenase/glutarate-semialdehyde dehydrogenase
MIMTLLAIDPSNGQVVKSYAEMTSAEVGSIIESVDNAYIEWSKAPISKREELMSILADKLRARAQEFAELMAVEMGKPVRDGRLEVVKCADSCDYFAEHAQTFLQSRVLTLVDKQCVVSYQPIGVVLAIMPWNFPFWQAFRFLIPTLMAGNTALLKHASNVPGCALAIEDLIKTAGFPPNVFRSLMIGASAVSEVIEHPAVKAVSLTGSTQAGQQVAAKAGSLAKKTVLELGGSDPYIILEDADLDKAVSICVSSRLTNSGQSCIAAKRFIVVESVREEFEQRFVAAMQKAVMGNPKEEETEIGPQARHDLRDALHQQVKTSIEKGARCLLGGEIPAGKGAFYPPTVLTNVKAGMPAYDEELFGPVAAIISVADEAEAIRVANDTIYGLGAAVFTEDSVHGVEIATHKIQAGNVAVNGLVKSDPRLPFGGIKSSGYGRELSEEGIKEFVNVKTVCLC